jgi:hypothetical protein
MFKNNASNRKVLVIDTCGEKFNQMDVFGSNFSDWNVVKFTPNLYGDVATISKDNYQNYLGWSLYNVLNRGKSSRNTDFSLTPFNHATPFSKCIQIHMDKANAVFKRPINIADLIDNPKDLNQAKSMLKDSFDIYSHFLSKHNLLTDVEALFK